MRILGIDPGIGRCGWGVIEAENAKLKMQNCGCIETSSKQTVEKRLEEIHAAISKLIKTYSPDALAIEELFFNTNAKTAFVVGQARGVILLAAAERKLEIAIYTPLQVKLALTGYGRAEKPQVGQMVKTLLGLKAVPKPDDTADGLAIAITHAFSAKTAKLTK
ncbi:MAG: crossover junction endodeoxyribonuclease RuvC [Candidatus Levyibacteriota bacterium]|jgi:crossover junction endodeoxyribonuclease RuvC